MKLSEHPTVIAHAARAARPPQTTLSAAALRERILAAGADDAGFVRIDDPALDDQRRLILGAFPRTRALLSFVVRTNRENVRTPARSIANGEFHGRRDDVDEVGRAIAAELEGQGVPALSPPMAFPMEAGSWPGRMWIVSHKPVAVAAGLGKMGIHRNVIHPVFGNFILLGTVLIGADVDAYDRPLDYNPCLECKLCVAACPTGAIGSDGAFNFGACFTHNYREFMGGFSDWVDTVADSGSAAAYRKNVTQAETVSMWQSLSYGANYKAAYCLAVCPAGEDVIGPFLADRAGFVADVVKPLQDRAEVVYVTRESDAEAHVARRFANKRTEVVNSGLRVPSIATFLFGITLSFQRERARDVLATYHLHFTGIETRDATIRIDRGSLAVEDGHVGTADLSIAADARSWLAFVNRETPLWRLLLSRKDPAEGTAAFVSRIRQMFLDVSVIRPERRSASSTNGGRRRIRHRDRVR